jgi:hypothetical protein
LRRRQANNAEFLSGIDTFRNQNFPVPRSLALFSGFVKVISGIE